MSDDLHDIAGEVGLGNVGVLARSPLAYGVLTGRWTEARTFTDVDHRRARWTKAALGKRVRQVNHLRYLVHGDVKSLAAAAIRYVLCNAVVTTCLVGARTGGQAYEASLCADGPPYLPEEDLQRLPQVLAAAGV